MKLSEMKQVLAANELRLTKSLGQNFLHDQNQLLRIIEAAELSIRDKVLEIGPGLGPLTKLLIERAGTVLAIEKDARLVKFLEGRFQTRAVPESQLDPEMASGAGLQLVYGDALDFLKRKARDWSQWKLVANLPYSVASPMLVELAIGESGPERMVATLQIEVARRLIARAGSSDYGVLTLLVQLDYESLGWFKIPAGCFFPEPDIDSACVSLVRRRAPLLPRELRGTFGGLVKRSFSQRRKMMLKLLKADWPSTTLESAFAHLGIPAEARAETLDLEQFVRLTQILAANCQT
ncbi:MAG: 16S rRNA (adenine(1518)-N(6)/adenine(1519)-N(6))-dimethyltransferase RsmA [Limisphaerales bacterium]